MSCDRLGGLTRAVVLVKAPRGYLACGYFSLASADKFGEACGLVTGVDCAEDVLGVRLTAVSRRGAELGLAVGMLGREALELLKGGGESAAGVVASGEGAAKAKAPGSKL